MLTVAIHNEAIEAAQKASTDMYNRIGDDFPCGFAWVTAYVKGNTKLGKSFKALGFKKAYGGGYQLWNPSGIGVQNVDIKEAGAEAYASIVKKYLPDVSIYSGSRLD